MKPSYGTPTSELALLAKLLTNNLSTPQHDNGTRMTPNPEQVKLAPPVKKEKSLFTPARVRLGNWFTSARKPTIKEEKAPQSPSSSYSEDMEVPPVITTPVKQKARAGFRSYFFSNRKKPEEKEEEPVASPKALFQGEQESGGGAKPPSPTESLTDIVNNIEAKLSDYTIDAIRELFTRLYPDKKFPNNIKSKEKAIKKFKLEELHENRNRAELNRINQASSGFITEKTKGVTMKRGGGGIKIPTLGIRT